MAKIKLSDYIAKRLKEHGVEHFFMVSGGGAMHLNDSLGRQIPYTCNHHEQGSAFAAEGYARVNQRLAVVNVTTGPGGLNCLNGVFGQWTDSVPVLYISGQVKRVTMLDNCNPPIRQLGDQEVDIISVVKPLTKYAVCVKEPNEIKYHIDKAIYLATHGRFAPCWIDVPIDVQSSLIEEDDLIEFKLDEMIKDNLSSPLAGEGMGEGYYTSHRVYAPYIKDFARKLRREQTEEEQKLWSFLRNSQIGYKFRRQFPIDNKYIADFVCLKKRLIIELDGGHHLDLNNDKERTLYLKEKDFRIIRFWNNDINNNIEECYRIIKEELETPHPSPLPQGARELSKEEIFYTKSFPQGMRELIDEISEKLNASKRPLIIAGHGIRLSGMREEFKKIVKALDIPVVTTLNSYDLMPTDDKNYIGRIGTIGQRAGNFALQNADLLLCLGTRNNVRQVSYNWENFGKNAYKIVVDIDRAELEKPLVKPDLAVCADLKEFLPELLNKSNMINLEEKDSKWLEFCQKLKDKYCFENYKEQEQGEKINPYYFTNALTKCMKGNDILISTNGSASVCLFQNAVIKENQRVMVNSGNASMGFGLPAAIGASYEAKGRNVICLEGDGSIMMNIQELQTIKHNKLPIKLFVINNNGYSSIRQSQKNFFNGNMTGSGVDSGVSVPDFVKVGEAFGIKTVRIDNPKTMEEDIKQVLEYNGAIFCEVMTEEEYLFLPKLSSRTLEDGTMVSASLEDMYPFLPREEFEENIL